MTERDPRFDRPRANDDSGAPVGRYPIPEASGLRAVSCRHCSRPIGLSLWEYANGFLVLCPHCRGYHGKEWGFQRTLLAGLILNAVSFFFVLRPRWAVLALAAHALLGWLLLAPVAQDELPSTTYTAVAFGVVLLGPVLVNGVLLVRHQMKLDAAPPDERAPV